MAIIKKKAKKAITRQVRKLVKKHGPEIALGAATALVGSVVAAVGGGQETKGKKKSDSDKPPKKVASKKKPAKAQAPGKSGKKTQKDEGQRQT